MKSSRPVDPKGEVLVPGEKEQIVMADRLQNGLPLSAETWSDILSATGKVGMSQSETDAIIGA